MWHRALYRVWFVNILVTAVESTIEMTNFTKVTLISESVQTNKVLSYIQCTDSANRLVTSKLLSITPSSPCGTCFGVFQQSPGFKLEYRAGQGVLSYTSASSYLVMVSCENAIDSPAVETIEVVVVPKSAPYFNITSADDTTRQVTVNVSSGSAAGSLIYQVEAEDDDEGDHVIYMLEVIPATSSGHFRIDQFTGRITTTTRLRSVCEKDVTLLVTITDGKNTAGPLLIDVHITDPNVPPVATNLDCTVEIPESSSGTAYQMSFTDGNNDVVIYTWSTTNAAGAAQFKIIVDSADITIATKLNYEDINVRQTELAIQLTDGHCDSPPYKLILKITDVNEPPVITPSKITLEICEGKIEFNPGFRVTDEDRVDTHKWSISNRTRDPSGHFGIDKDTGVIRTLLDYDVDFNRMSITRTIIVQVTDKGGLTATATVSVIFLDCNDNAPVFQSPNYTGVATECTAAGSILFRVSAHDNDTSREQNNVLYYSGSGGSVHVGTAGEVIVSSALPAGTVVTFLVYAYDRGQTPGPLVSVNPAVISVRFTPCPRVVTTQKPVTTQTPGTTVVTTVGPKQIDNTPWIIIAALLGTFLLGLSGFMLWRYGSRCARSCSRISCDDSWCRPRPKNRIIKVRPATPDAPENIYDEIEEPDPPGAGFLFGFWKERYPNDDFKFQPDRKRLPTPGDMEDRNPHTIDPPVEEPTPPESPDTVEVKKRWCLVM